MKKLFILGAFMACAVTGGLIGFAESPVPVIAASSAPAAVSPGSESATPTINPVTHSGKTSLNAVIEHATNQSSKKQSKVVYLTFDDGPTPGYTNAVLADLNAANAHATFFEVGIHMQNEQSLIAQQLADGDQIGTHTWDHADLATLNQAQTQSEVSQAINLQYSYTGYDSTLFRFPYFIEGTYGAAVTAALGRNDVWTDIDPSDWEPGVSDTKVINTIINNLYNGATVDLHDGNGPDPGPPASRSTPTYLPKLLTRLKSAGYTTGILGTTVTTCGDVCNAVDRRVSDATCQSIAYRVGYFVNKVRSNPTVHRREAALASENAFYHDRCAQ